MGSVGVAEGTCRDLFLCSCLVACRCLIARCCVVPCRCLITCSRFIARYSTVTGRSILPPPPTQKGRKHPTPYEAE